MCGIAGLFAPGRQADPQTVRAMTDAIQHRGPDDAGVEVLANGQVALGHRRLSILDLSPLGHQPMMDPSGRLWITYNGEIYNFKEVRAELEATGDSFRSGSDTEVLLAAYRRWGRDCLRRFRGMFALALWDADSQSLVLIRDRFGVKPLYYRIAAGRFSFASEIRGLLADGAGRHEIEASSAAEFLRFGYVSAPKSMFADIAAVPPGCILTVDRNLRPTTETYWEPSVLFAGDSAVELQRELNGLDEEAILIRFEQALTDAFALRMVSDVPVGLFLSGGIDSTVVATLLARRLDIRPRTFTIGYADSSFNEIPYARAVAQELGTQHTELEVSESLALQVTERLLDSADEPIGDSSIIPTFLVCQLARQSVTVALSADGADELLGGYARYEVCARFGKSIDGWMRFAYLASAAVLETLPPALIRLLYRFARRGGPGYAAIEEKVRKFVRMSRADSAHSAYNAGTAEFSDKEVLSLLSGALRKGALAPGRPLVPSCRDSREEFMLTDIRHYLVGDLLTKLDRASMAVSLEAREPFLDHQLAAMAAALPMRWKIRNGQGKYILRRILARHLRGDLFNRPKQGFSAPVGAWMRGALRSRVEAVLSASSIQECGLLDAQAVQSTLQRFMTDESVSAAGLWHLFQLQSWAAARGSSSLAPAP
jgi:asparagine synthase (glutamine-hydrolysing)